MKAALPSGTVTFLFTDIEDSSRRWEDQPAAMSSSLARHDELLRRAIAGSRGVVFSRAGDGVAAVFARAADAVDAAVSAQRAFAAEPWPVAIRVRMGLHTGEAEERDGDYFGPALNRAGRLMSLASGGQVLVSLATAEVVRDRLVQGLGLVEVGERALRSLKRPERVFELTWSGGEALVVRLLGDGDVRVGADPIDALASPRLRSLLAYVVLRRASPLSRRRVASRLWPESSEGQARTNLRRALHDLRQAVPDLDRHVRIDNDTMQWRAESTAEIDVVRFEAAAHTGLQAGDEPALARAAELYRGDLLDGCEDEWIAPERERLRGIALDVHKRLIDATRGRADTATAIVWGEGLLSLDPLDDATYRLLMQLHVAAGDRVSAMRVYHACVSTLKRELAVEPDPETVRFYDTFVAELPASGAGRQARGDTAVAGPPLIGREREWERLARGWQVVTGGQPQFVLVSGEPGIGKSRLVEDFRDWCGRASIPTVGARAYEADGNLPYGPIIDTLRSDAMRPSLAALDETWRHELGRLLPELVGVAPTEPAASDESARRRLFESIARVLVRPDRALVWAVDDLQWCDAETLDLLDFTIRFAAKASSPLLLIGTVREEELANQARLRSLVARLHALDVMVELPLGRLAGREASALALELLGDGADAALVERVVAGSEGNPLFLVETARSGLAELSSDDDGGPALLPPRIQAVIEARLDQLPAPARELATVAAVVGRAFTIDVVSRLVPDNSDVVAAIDDLWRRGIVRERGVDSYDFSHDKIREVAYHTIGPARRRHLHAAVAAALEATHAERIDAVAAQIAAHLERAGKAEVAIDYYRRAVAVAARVFAHFEVIAYCRSALELIAQREAGPDRDELELDFLVPLAVSTFAGPGEAQHSRINDRANALREQRGLAPEPSTVRLSANSAITRRSYPQARQLGQSLLGRGQHEDNTVLITEGHYVVGVTSFWLGELETSRQHLDLAVATYRPEHSAVHLTQFAQDPHTICLLRLALTLFQLGYETEAAALSDEGLVAATATGHSYTDIYARVFGGWYLAEAGWIERMTKLAEGLDPFTSTNRTAEAGQPMLLGWVRLVHGDADAALAHLDNALEAAVRAMLMLEPMVLILQAQAHAMNGDVAAGLAAARRVHAIATAEMPFHAPEAGRVLGELLLATGHDHEEGLAALREASETAARHGNVVHELRARSALLRAVRRHDRASVVAEANALQAVCGRLRPDSELAELEAARAEIAAG